MSNYTVKIKNSAKSDLKKIKHSYLKKSFLEIVETLKNDPYKITQSFEKLEPKYLERYSRRINHQHPFSVAVIFRTFWWYKCS